MIRRVFLSHTSEFATYPNGKSFVDAAKAAVNRAGCVPCDMDYFTARDQQPAQYCIDRVRECDVYVGIIGLRYGSPVRDRPEVSYTELEFEAASLVPAKTRLIFFLAPDALVPASLFTDDEYGKRQKEFRKRLSDARVTGKSFSDFHELEKLIFQALVEEFPVMPGASQKLERLDWPEGESPYPGLEWFDEKYAPLFFGRDREVNELVGKLSEPDGRFLIVSGPSGSGKSSLVAAGLWQTLVKDGRLPGSQSWKWLRITPAADSRGPFASLAAGLKQAFPKITTHADDVAATLAKEPATFQTCITSHMTSGQELVLFVDQLEELFTQAFPSAEIQSFLAQLIILSGDPKNRLRVVATIRSEFFGRLGESDGVREKINNGCHVLVGPILLMALQDMIQKPAAAIQNREAPEGYTFEPQLVDRIVDDAGKEPGHLPLVAYALKQLFEQRQGTMFTQAAYMAMKGVVGAIGAKADQVMKTLGQEADAAFDRVFAELVHIDRDRPPTRKRARLSDFAGDEDAMKVIRVLAGSDCRVLVTTGQVRTGSDGRVLVTAGERQEATVEVAHEKLFTAWPKLMKWIEDSGQALRDIEHAEVEARRWQKGGNNPQELWLVSRAKDVLVALHRFGKRPSPKLGRFLKPQQVLRAKLRHDALSHQERLLIGQKLAEFGDTRPGVGLTQDGLPDIAWITIAGGQVKLERIDHVFEVNPFRIAKYPVTNVQFDAFLTAEDGYRNEEWWEGIKKDCGPEQSKANAKWREENCPRESVTWYEAVAFCRWLSAKTGNSIRLPTEWEWQQAATGGDPQREYPWEGGWDAGRSNSSESRLDRTTAVGMHPQGATQQDVLDMAGNVWEWCLNGYENPEQPKALHIDKGGLRVLRGGSWDNGPGRLRASYRLWDFSDTRNYNLGFRLAQDMS